MWVLLSALFGGEQVQGNLRPIPIKARLSRSHHSCRRRHHSCLEPIASNNASPTTVVVAAAAEVAAELTTAAGASSAEDDGCAGGRKVSDDGTFPSGSAPAAGLLSGVPAAPTINISPGQ